MVASPRTTEHLTLRYAVALALLVALTLSSLWLMRGYIEDEHELDESRAAVAELRIQLPTLQIAMRDLVDELRNPETDTTRRRGLERRLSATAGRLADTRRRIERAMLASAMSRDAWQVVEDPPYRLDVVLDEMRDDVAVALAGEPSGDDAALSPDPRAEGFLDLTDGHAGAARMAAERLTALVEAESAAREEERELLHHRLGWATVAILFGEALVIFWPLLGRLGSEARRADDAVLELARLARHDALTGLLNRASLIAEIEAKLAGADPAFDKLAVMLIDLDKFKPINDRFGHAAGDRVLIEVARRLKSTLRPHDIVARLGGDEFVVVLPRAGGASELHDIGTRLERAIARDFDIDGHRLSVGGSIGCAVWPDDARDVDGLLYSADLAMYRAKREDSREPVFFEEELLSAQLQVRSEEAELRRSIDDGHLTLFFQPILSRCGRVHQGFEALVRLDHPELGLIEPDKFLPTAERAGLMSLLTTRVLEQACRQHATWCRHGLEPGLMTINVPEAFLIQPDAIEQVLTIAALNGMRTDRLVLEISERSMTGDDAAPVAQQIAAAHAAGLRIALDEFGLGQASLIHLRKPGIDILKIDRAFVRDLGSAPETVAIVGAMIELGRILDKQIVVEGVETTEQAAVLAVSESAWVQGYLYSRPLAGPAARDYLGARRRLEDQRRPVVADA